VDFITLTQIDHLTTWTAF